MEEQLNEDTVIVTFEIRVSNERKGGEIINAADVKGKLTLADAGRLGNGKANSFTIKIDGCDQTKDGELGYPKVTVSHHGALKLSETSSSR